MDGIGGILGYARAYRPMALSLPAVVGAAESTAGGQAGSAEPETPMSFLVRRVAGAPQASPSRSGMASPAYPHVSEIERPALFSAERP